MAIGYQIDVASTLKLTAEGTEGLLWSAANTAASNALITKASPDFFSGNLSNVKTGKRKNISQFCCADTLHTSADFI